MSLATRCTSCTTVFRVVQDQLKVSEGWVRCGRCDTVFNALEQLFDLERDGLPPDPATGEPASHDSLPDLPAEGAPKPPLPDAFDALLRERAATPAAAEPPLDAALAHRELLLDVPGAATTGAVDVAVGVPVDDAPSAADLPPPDFIRHAERNARWQTPRRRWALRGAALALLAALALQAIHHFRDALAAHWPEARPLLAAWCEPLGCRIEALRRIGDVTVENTGLTPGAAGAGSLQFTVTLRNRGSAPLALPSIDLTLTDSNGQLVARRALAPAEFTISDGSSGPRPALLRPHTDTRLATTLASAGRVVGYTVEVFYP